MSIKLGPYLFTGPFQIDTTEIRANHAPSVYAVIAKGGPAWAPVFRVVDLGISPERGIRFTNHPRQDDWRLEVGESLAIYLFDTPGPEQATVPREQVLQELCRQFDPPRGIVSLG